MICYLHSVNVIGGRNDAIEVKPELLRWARERAGFAIQELAKDYPQLPAWERGVIKPTLKQIERFAHKVNAPLGYLFLQEPPVEQLPIPDFRTIRNRYIGHPSPDLLETIYICQQRQEWYRDYAQSMRETTCSFVGAADLANDVETVATRIRHALDFDLDARRQLRTWVEALRRFIEQADSSGVLVMVNGVVGSNTHRKLDPDEFRGFALSDKLAPLIFINGSETKSTQMFTLAHELAHIWLGETGLSDLEPVCSPSNRVEKWCNRVAAEILVPLIALREEYRETGDLTGEVSRLARTFKVSALVILRRIQDAGHLAQDELRTFYQKELERLQAIPKGSGGNFYLTQAARVSKRFARALIASTLKGQTLHRDAFRLLGFSKLTTFRELGNSLGVV
ncbi:MAG: XRE family transcriptional regulator [Coprothermobacterota bacterium]|nr:XRE family transcriptional regulator [Coprothermobacterota bacterium]